MQEMHLNNPGFHQKVQVKSNKTTKTKSIDIALTRQDKV